MHHTRARRIALGLVLVFFGAALPTSHAAAWQPAAPAPAAPTRTPEPAAAPKPTPDAAPAPEAPATLRIGTWNIEWLGQPQKRSGAAANFAQKPDEIAEYIAQSGVSVLALQEAVAGGDRPRCPALDAAVASLKKRTSAEWRYVLFPGREREPSQLTGVLWDTSRVSPIGPDGKRLAAEADPQSAAVQVQLPKMRGTRTRLWNKPPYAMKFSAGPGKTDFVLIVIHMKADYQEDHALTREEEAKNLVEALPGVRKAFSDDDLVIAGDTNTTKTDEKALRLLAAAKLVDSNLKGDRTNWREGSMDKLFFPAAQPEFKDRAGDVLSDRFLESKRWRPVDFKKHLSDHFLVSTTITIMADDD
ncbi:MAG: endonuclease/exonuclease/phosphatase family protein [Chloroflexi bacterium]|nr:endonuclease/exonuclease/phosphatase family protein [Chloroflexota bacterium]